MPDLACESCGEWFRQGQGRPARRCPRCRGDASERYGPVHQALKASGPAAGTPCTRCQRPILAGQRASPDHLDGGGPTEYAGWAHEACNLSAGAAYGNRLRAHAYRTLMGAILAPPSSRTQVQAPVVVDDHACTDAGCHVDQDRCSCGRHSRGW